MTDEELAEIERSIDACESPGAWGGGSQELAPEARRLLTEVKRLRSELAAARPPYTTEVPTEPGWYWRRGLPGLPDLEEVIHMPAGELEVMREAKAGGHLHPSIEWSGPIPRPPLGQGVGGSA